MKSFWDKATFLECYKHLWRASSKSELNHFVDEITHHSLVHEDVKSILDGFPSRAHPMGVLSSLVSSLTSILSKISRSK